jgi:hypothetical protein
MARKYRYRRTGEHFGWNMNECEERLLIAAYEEVAPRMPETVAKREFIMNFYENGKGVIFPNVDHINATRRRVGFEPVTFIETDVDSYGRVGALPDDARLKSERRRAWQQEYLALDTAGRLKWQQQAEFDAQLLPAPHKTLAEYEAEQERIQSEVKLTTTERNRRATVVAPAPVSDTSRALRQLKLVHDRPDIVAKIIAALAPDAALAVAENGELSDSELIAALVVRSLDET